MLHPSSARDGGSESKMCQDLEYTCIQAGHARVQASANPFHYLNMCTKRFSISHGMLCVFHKNSMPAAECVRFESSARKGTSTLHCEPLMLYSEN